MFMTYLMWINIWMDLISRTNFEKSPLLDRSIFTQRISRGLIFVGKSKKIANLGNFMHPKTYVRTFILMTYPKNFSLCSFIENTMTPHEAGFDAYMTGFGKCPLCFFSVTLGLGRVALIKTLAYDSHIILFQCLQVLEVLVYMLIFNYFKLPKSYALPNMR